MIAFLQMTEKEYWEKVNDKFNELIAEFHRRYERSTNTDFIYEAVLSELCKL